MTIPYRTRRTLQNIGVFLLILVLVAALVWLVWLLWLDRYVVYTRDGAKLNFDLAVDEFSGVAATRPETGETISIYYNEGDDKIDTDPELVRLSGYYIDADMLRNEMDTVVSQLKRLPPETPIMIDLKDISGRFYYSTVLGVDTDTKMDIDEVDALIELLQERNFYTIARIPAFRDRLRGLSHTSDGLYRPDRYALWMDSKGCYWMNPTKDGTLGYLMEIVSELKALGFDEVVFDEFRFPDTDQIYFFDDREEALANAAVKLEAACATDSFAVSFVFSDAGYALPDGRTRLYITDMDAADVASFAEELDLELAEARLVFLTDSRDTRFQEYGILRPITSEILVEENTAE